MKTQGRRKRTPQPVPIEPRAWSLWGADERAAYYNAAAHRTLWVRLPKARRIGQRVETKHGRVVLLWSLAVTDDLTICALAAPHEREAFALVLHQGYAVADYIPAIEPSRSRRWHQRRAVENAKTVAAVLRAIDNERHVAEPMKPADVDWMRRQLGTLDSQLGEG
jgi:hypothetical protein